MILEKLARLRRFFFGQWWRFEQGSRFLSLFSFCMLSVGVLKILGFSGFYVFAMVPVAVFGMWLWGYFLDRFGKIQQQMEHQTYSRSPYWADLWKRLDRIEEKIGKNE